MKDSVKDHLTQEKLDEIDRRIDSNDEILLCSDVAPEGKKRDDAGVGRCTFELEDNVLKIAKTVEGRRENENVKIIQEELKDNSYAFAQPKDISDNNVAMVQEKVTPAHDYYDGKQDTRFNIKQDVKDLKEKLDDIHHETGIVCDDVLGVNIGVRSKGDINHETVLLDIGECKRNSFREGYQT